MQVITKRSGESFPHRIIWRSALKLNEQARAEEKGSKYFDLSFMLMAYLAYEAYLNFVGDRLDPQAWSDEKAYFNTNEYRGTEGKLKRIIEKCPNLIVNKGVRPFQTIYKLYEFRDSLVHAKVMKYTDYQEHSNDEEPDFWPKSSYDFVTQEQAGIVLNDVEEFIEFLHKNIKENVNDNWFGDKALRGIIGHASSSTTVKM